MITGISSYESVIVYQEGTANSSNLHCWILLVQSVLHTAKVGNLRDMHGYLCAHMP